MISIVCTAPLPFFITSIARLLIPELENYDGNGADIFSPEAAAIIRSYVNSGNRMLAFSATDEILEMVNSLLDLATV